MKVAIFSTFVPIVFQLSLLWPQETGAQDQFPCDSMSASCIFYKLPFEDHEVNNCTKYIDCQLGQRYDRSCPDGQYFNKFKMICEGDFDCAGPPPVPPCDEDLPVELIPHPTEPNKYYVCMQGSLRDLVSCPQGEKFDSITEFCVPEGSATSSTPADTSDPDFPDYTISTTTEEPTTCTPCYCSTTEIPTMTTAPPPCNPGGDPYNLPYPGNCSLYWRCISGVPLVEVCSPLVFDEEDRICKPTDDAVCHEEDPIRCDPEDGHITYPHKSNCSKYYECYYGEFFEVECAANTYFDARPEFLRCNLAEQADTLCNSECQAEGIHLVPIRGKSCQWYKICTDGNSENLVCDDDMVVDPDADPDSPCVSGDGSTCPYARNTYWYKWFGY